MKNITTIDLPTPPHRRHLGKCDSVEFRSWLEAAGRRVIASTPSTIHGYVAVRILASLPSEPFELGHVAAPIIDLLEIHDVLAKDAVSDIAMRWDRTIADGMVQVEFRRANPPDYRVNASGRAKIAKAQRERWARARAAKADAAEERHSDV